MRTKRIKVYKFDELSDEAKQTVINKERESYYHYNDFAEWTIDNCYLLEPPHSELVKLFGKDYNYSHPIIGNNRKVYFSCDRDRYIDISNAVEINNSYQFLKWLGLNDRLIAKCDYTIGKDTIEFANQSHLEFTTIEQTKLDNATAKFEQHCESVLNDIERQIDYNFTDEAIIEDMNNNLSDREYTEDGQIFNY